MPGHSVMRQTSAFIISKHTEGSTDYLLPKRNLAVCSYCTSKLSWHLSTYITANHGCHALWPATHLHSPHNALHSLVNCLACITKTCVFNYKFQAAILLFIIMVFNVLYEQNNRHLACFPRVTAIQVPLKYHYIVVPFCFLVALSFLFETLPRATWLYNTCTNNYI